MSYNSKEDQKVIRKALRKLCKMKGLKATSLSVKNGRGTAYGWTHISGSLQHGYFTDEESEVIESFGLIRGGNAALISPDDRDRYVEKAVAVLGV